MEVILQWTIGTNVAFISSYLLARIPLVSTNIKHRVGTQYLYGKRVSETEIITVKIPPALDSKIQMH